EAESRLRALVERAATAPAGLAGTARDGAATLLAAPRSVDTAAALSAVARAQAELERDLDQLPAFTEASGKQTEAEETQRRVVERKPTRRQRNAADTVMKAAAAAFDGRDWAAANDSYAKAVAD